MSADGQTVTLRDTRGQVLWRGEAESLKDAVTRAVQDGRALRGAVLYCADLSGTDLRGAQLHGALLTHATLTRANLSGADLSEADLTGADLTEADLSDTDLRRSDLTRTDLAQATLDRAKLTGARLGGGNLSRASLTGTQVHDTFAGPVPVVQDLHRRLADVLQDPSLLDMATWHCETTHCRAGWIVTLAGPAGQAFETSVGVCTAAALISRASEPGTFEHERIPDFFTTKALALADIRRLGLQQGRADPANPPPAPA